MFLRRNVVGQTFVFPGPLLLVADGSAVTSAASVTVVLDGVSAPGSGLLSHVASGAWSYTPTQAETDCQILGYVLTATGAAAVCGSVRTTGGDPNDAAALGLTRLDAAVSTRLPTSSYAAPLDAAGTRTAVGLASANLDTQLSGIAADLPGRVTKNTALAGFMFFMTDSSDHVSGKTGLTVTATRSLDGAAFAACANAASEVSDGWYKIDLAAADLNGNVVALRFSATGADTRNVTVVTQPT